MGISVLNEKYSEFCAQFEAAEHRIKQFEKLEFIPIIPAINQLRYAACHLKESFQAKDEEEERECIQSAERHCRRAIHDACEAVVDYVAMWVAEFEKGFKYIPLSSELPKHVEMRGTIREAVSYVAEHNHETADDPQVIESLDEYVEKLLAIQVRYEDARDPLNKRARNARWKAIGVLAGLLFAFLGALVGVLVLFCD